MEDFTDGKRKTPKGILYHRARYMSSWYALRTSELARPFSVVGTKADKSSIFGEVPSTNLKIHTSPLKLRPQTHCNLNIKREQVPTRHQALRTTGPIHHHKSSTMSKALISTLPLPEPNEVVSRDDGVLKTWL